MTDLSRLPWPVVEHWDWQRHAACRGEDVAVFFHPDRERDPSRTARVDGARRICARCPVITVCRDWAREVEEPFGVWGGESEDERREFLARRRGDRRRSGARPAA